MIYYDRIFEDADVTLDDNQYRGCTFRRCTVHYNGGAFSLRVNNFDHCHFEFSGAAAKTVAFLRLIFSGGENGQAMILGLLQEKKAE